MISNFKSLFLTLLVSPIVFGQIKSDEWHLYANSRENYYGVAMANGQIGIVTDDTPLKTKEIILNGVYDGSPENGISRIVRGIEFLNLHLTINNQDIKSDNIDNWSQVVSMKEGTSTTSFNFKDFARINYTILTNRAIPFSAMAIVEIMPNKDIEIIANNYMIVPDELKDAKSQFRVLKDNQYMMPVFGTTARTLTGKYIVAASTTFLFDGQSESLKQTGNEVGFTKKLLKGKKYRFAVAGGICTSKDVTDPLNESERQPIYALQEGIDKLLNRHKQAWAELWNTGDIQIEGDLDAQQRVRFALYNLYSYIRPETRQSIAPMGLSSQGYNGHIFWDSELWMYPTLLALQPDMAKSCLDYRSDRLQKAKQKAFIYGYKGAMYPWESDDTGEEATPTWALTGIFEQHITADVSIAFWNYYAYTQDKSWLRKEWNVLKETADFWVSRVVKNQDGSFSILNVVGADEYAQHIDDNAFTNASAIESLKNTIKAATILNEPINPKWAAVSDKLAIHVENGITQNYKGYQGQIIKQADVNLLAYPLHVITDKDQIKRDLEYYAEKIDKKDGPAMASGVLSVLYARLGDKEKAYSYFVKSYLPNSRPPFGVFSESANSNNPYFATGAGAMLQAVIYGFGGVEQTDLGLKYNKGLLPKKWKSLKIIGLGLDNKTITIE
ncbi:glycosyl hydrolase family 95 catalytic domain-containing protein [Flavobacterium gawalongense]|uniref:Glycoside hydrolase family 65 protein n=1 Tax=Flavobacterium gawalongense TaxID=2594432 RepID=A0A553BXA4_9FLAO|nr:glycoside hydrolase family 65 protein [Flavobacterium gawalongense]TRX04208.1 glycoside hydrolase family 65 protein [Flavobacterium gawalongense]TRX09342.1 glycoside hydrolase family 65 protein [Flavobacterium gawalongense]TRX12844.1 glycoside hydrolase family 65 protein [Flavobacterium gawalongense]TRX13189.1 glycoside hydrolase family 65 protein [Flavobacterium gawalongense]TRX30749.1 glycoside hydrolase family 65 protein [Flavobacterium gawalongense]